MYLEGKSHPWSSERWQRTIRNREKRENCPRALHIVLSPPDKQSSPCQPHACPSNLPLWFVCVGVAPGTSPFGSTAAVGGRVPTPPVVLGVYTPSSMPMKSEPFCIVMEAPAALSTNMEVYWPACGEGDRQPGVSAEQRQTCMCLCAPPTCSSSRPCTLTVNILLLLSNPTIISRELQSKRNGHKCKQKRIFIFNQYSCP